jgi:hypothetical protein
MRFSRVTAAPSIALGRATTTVSLHCHAGFDFYHAWSVQVIIQVSEKVNIMHEAGYAHLDLQPLHLIWCASERTWSLSNFTRTTYFGSVLAMPTFLVKPC